VNKVRDAIRRREVLLARSKQNLQDVFFLTYLLNLLKSILYVERILLSFP